ncbi:MAG: response regulator transcription factor [Spirochaetales bacterium]|nr:response regulator transcription factor [Spirochaetales bacterium]
MNQKNVIRVVIADDQELFAQSLHYVIEARADDIKIVDIAGNGEEAVATAKKYKPDVILMDVRMPKLDGVQATKIILGDNPNIRILMLSTFQDDEYVRTAIKYGAVGYLLKNIAPEKVIKSIRAVHCGIVQISPIIAQALIKGDKTPDKDELENDDLFFEPLTNREKEVLQLIVKSYENRQIAIFLNVTEQTAKNYVHNLYMKLGVSSRMQLLRVLQKPGLMKHFDLKS